MFMEALEKEINGQLVMTENGALGYSTWGDSFVNFNFRITSYRRGKFTPYADFLEMTRDDQLLAMKMLFFLRDIRGGIGERDTFRYILMNYAHEEPEMVSKVIHLIPEYGRWDDLFVLFDTPLEDEMVSFVKNQLKKDVDSMKAKGPVTLLAKWMPSINTSSRDTVYMANRFLKKLKMSPAVYRKILSSLRGYLKVVERDLSAKQYDNIDYATIPSKAHLRYKNVFLKKDEDRYLGYLESLKKGETKINAGALAPYEIWHKYTANSWGWTKNPGPYDETLEQMWKSLPETGNLSNTLVVADGSGSMSTSISGETSALDVAQSLAVYFGERCEGEFKNKFITFSEKPQLVHFGDSTLRSKIEIVAKYTEVANTNLEKVFKLILDTAVKNKCSQEDLPETILVISDMEFDDALDQNVNKALMDNISDKYREAGYILPRLSFWNVCSRTGTIPIQSNEAGVVLVSGFNTSAVKMIMTGQLDPFLAIKEVLDGDRYKMIEEALCLS